MQIRPVVEADHEQIQQDDFVFLENLRQFLVLTVLLILILLPCAFLPHRLDILHQQIDQHRGDCDCDSADQKSKPQILFKQKARDHGGRHQTDVGAEILQGIRPLPVPGIGDIRNQGIVCRMLHTLARRRDHNQGNRPIS